MTSMTIETHTETAGGFQLVVRVPNTTVDSFAGIAGDASADGVDVLYTTVWPANVPPSRQRLEARRLIGAALSPAALDEPVEVTAPGTEL